MLRKIKGFTLLELIVVIVILGILAALAIPTFAKVIERSNISVATTELQAVAREATAIAAFNGEGSAKFTLDQFLETGVASSAYSAGTYAASASLKSIAWFPPGADAPLDTVTATGNRLDQVSDKNGYFSLSYSDENSGAVGLAMRTGDGANCVFVAYENGALKGVDSKAYTASGDEACRGTVALKDLTDVETGTGGGSTNPDGSATPGTIDNGNTPGTLPETGGNGNNPPGGNPGPGNGGGDVEGLDYFAELMYYDPPAAWNSPTQEELAVTFNSLPAGAVQDDDHVKLTCTSAARNYPGESYTFEDNGTFYAGWIFGTPMTDQSTGESFLGNIAADFAPHSYDCNLTLTDINNNVLVSTDFTRSTDGHAPHEFDLTLEGNYNTGQQLSISTTFNGELDHRFAEQVASMTSTCEAVDFNQVQPSSQSQVGKVYTQSWSSTLVANPDTSLHTKWSVDMHIENSGGATMPAGNIFTCDTTAFDAKGTPIGVAHDEGIEIGFFG